MRSKGNEVADSVNVLETLVTTLKELTISETYEASVNDNNTTRVVLRQAQAVDNQVEKIIVTLKGQK